MESALSKARRTFQKYQNNLGYDILRIHGCKANIEIDDKQVKGTAYLQKVRVQAPSVLGIGVFFISQTVIFRLVLPHLSLLALSSSDKPWQLKDSMEIPLRKLVYFMMLKGKEVKSLQN